MAAAKKARKKAGGAPRKAAKKVAKSSRAAARGGRPEAGKTAKPKGRAKGKPPKAAKKAPGGPSGGTAGKAPAKTPKKAPGTQMPAEARPVAPEDCVGAALVVGGGVGGIQAALDLAESGIKVYLLDTKPSIGGTMSQLDKTFPTNDCSLCILSPKMVEAGRHRNIELLTYSELKALEGGPGRFRARVLRRARSVDMTKCTGCGTCSRECLVRRRIRIPEPAPVAPDAKVSEIVARYGGDPGMLIPMMQDIQAEFGYLPREKLACLSQTIGVQLSQICGIATFYASFRLQPRGEHTVTLCMGTVCYLKGADRISEAIQSEFAVKPGGTTKDGKLTLIRVNCLGACALAPVVVVDGEYHGGMTAGATVDLLHRVAEGAPAAAGAETA